MFSRLSIWMTLAIPPLALLVFQFGSAIGVAQAYYFAAGWLPLPISNFLTSQTFLLLILIATYFVAATHVWREYNAGQAMRHHLRELANEQALQIIRVRAEIKLCQQSVEAKSDETNRTLALYRKDIEDYRHDMQNRFVDVNMSVDAIKTHERQLEEIEQKLQQMQ